MNGTEEIRRKISSIYQRWEIDREWFAPHLGQAYIGDRDLAEDIRWKLGNTYQKRRTDRRWFVLHLGEAFMKDNDVHHTWLKGGYCFILTKQEHGKLHGAGQRC
jgi:hypothetical protein